MVVPRTKTLVSFAILRLILEFSHLLLVFEAAQDHLCKGDDVGEFTIGSLLVVDGPSSFIEIRSEIAYSLPVLIFLLGHMVDPGPLASESDVAVAVVLEAVDGVLHLQEKVNNDKEQDAGEDQERENEKCEEGNEKEKEQNVSDNCLEKNNVSVFDDASVNSIDSAQ